MTDLLNLKKKFELNLKKAGMVTIPTMRVKLAMDSSGSMNHLFNRDWVQTAVERLAAAALLFDDNGELEMAAYSGELNQYPVVTRENCQGYIQNNRIRADGGTCYKPVFEWFLEQEIDLVSKPASGFFGRLLGKTTDHQVVVPPANPTYGLMVTDGEAQDEQAARTYLERNNRPEELFVQFILLGNSVRTQLFEDLCRMYPNMDYRVIQDPEKLDVDGFYQNLANARMIDWSKSLQK